MRRERDEHYAERDEERQEQEDNEQELIKELRKNKVTQACSLFRIMFRRYHEAGILNRGSFSFLHKTLLVIQQVGLPLLLECSYVFLP